MSAAIFDSHKYAKRLIEAGVEAKAADVQAETMVEVMTQVAASSATIDKQDSKLNRLDSKIDLLAAEMRAQHAELRALIERNSKESTRWLMGVVISVGVLQSALVTGLALKLLH
ncbi:hypothetical protein ACFOLJ_12985 [Rugamonas sp. CCM 8940]|uniref:hypothetical protein n=1 Tax=Rugamonas sp. CCM 8940 TaxID=2765359 RepID=UPI0018F5E1E0|nr:hypothetical protein [Rugamonas sp. CCM 8940]MBJ7308909.1 hypothetical protein [Rugamonas sp. CCM 8940]